MSSALSTIKKHGFDRITYDDVQTELAERKLSHFIRQAWNILEPNTPYRHGWHVDAIAEHLEAVSLGQIQSLVINVPPGHMKSLETCVFWPAWDWLQHPHLRWIFASYSSDLSVRDSNKMRKLISSSWFRGRWGNRFRVTKDNETRVENDKTGLRIATSTGGLGTGERVHRAVHDDLLRANDKHSAAMRKQAEEHLRAMSTRGVAPEEYAQVLIMQRLHEKDPTGYVLEQGGWEHLCLPFEYDPKRARVTSIGWKDPRKKEGDILWPQMHTKESLSFLKNSLGSYGTAGELQQLPAPADGGIVLRKWWKFYQELPKRFDHIIDSWDMAFKGNEDSAYVVGQKWGAIGIDRYLIKQIRAKMTFTSSSTAVVMLHTPETEAVVVEDKANGPAIIDALKKKVPGLIPYPPRGSKEARAHAAAPIVEAGNAYLPDPQVEPWVEDFIDEWAAAPNGEYWDQVDAGGQALDYMRKYDEVTAIAPFSVRGQSYFKGR